MSLYRLATGALRTLDPETAHGLTIEALKQGFGPRDKSPDDPILETEVAGLKLPNCVGLAAGFDKSAEVPDAMLRTGFGFVECGTLTPRPQPGNPRPRLFRLSEDRAVINRMGFNNDGVEAAAERLSARRSNFKGGVVGANLGANKDSEDRIGDYVSGLTRLWGLAQYFTVNISSPNTPGLRGLQSKDALEELLGRLGEARATLPPNAAPIFLKVAPDLDDAEVEAIVEAVVGSVAHGIVVSNTTVERPPTLKSLQRSETGGLSGAPLFERSNSALRRFADVAQGRVPLVGVGGVGSGADAYAKIRAGASAVQLYTAMVFEGPDLIARIKRDLAQRIRSDGFASVAAAVGRR